MTITETPPAAVRPRRALMPVSWLAYLYAPILPYLKKFTIVRRRDRTFSPDDILVPEGYTTDLVACGFNTPVHCCFDEAGSCYVTEAGHKVPAAPRILKVDTRTGQWEVFYQLPEERWNKTGAMTGACWHEGALYMMNTDTLLRLGPGGEAEPVVTGLASRGDHQSNYPVAGPDGKLYFGQGTATNTGVVGADNFGYEWLPKFPEFHDVPAEDIELVGRNYEYRNVLGDVTQKVRSGAYVPFGTETRPGQVIKGSVRCTGAVLRCNPDGSDLEVVAWGLRNPYGIAFHPDGRLFATEHGIDDRSQRYIVGDPDDFYEIRQGAWYGWPDFASGIRLDDPHWGEGGQGREPALAKHPDPNPPKPLVSFVDHTGANGVDFSRDGRFGFVGDAFVALFGDIAPLTTRAVSPRGFKVVRVDMQRRRIVDFAANAIAGPASGLPHRGFERPSHCQFGPDGALYVVDYGEIVIAPEKGGIRTPLRSGALWRIRRTEGPAGEQPPKSVEVPIHGVKYLGIAAGVLGALALLVWLAVRLVRGRWG